MVENPDKGVDPKDVPAIIKKKTHDRQISQKAPIIGRESFEEWFNESNRSERASNRKRRLKQQQKAIKDNIKCTYDNPCETRKWEQGKGRDSLGITGIEGKKFCLWCNNLYEPKQ